MNGQATDGWWGEHREHATILELRRQRTRNALVHGGPEAPGSVANVIEFAESIAVNALHASLDGKLRGHDLIDHFIDHFIDRRKRLAEMRARLSRGDRPEDVLFPDSD